MSPRKFRFGITAARFGTSQQQWLEFARKAEGLGYSVLLMPDHFGPQLAPLLGLVAAAGVTSTLRFGTLVLDNDYRYPTMLAKEAASVDMLTGGRFELGLGAGWMEEEYKQADIPFQPAGARVERLAEAISIIKASFNAGPVTFQGKHYNVQGLETNPKPSQAHLPLQIGAGGRRMLTLAAKEADIIGVAGGPLSGIETPPDENALFAEKLKVIRTTAGPRYNDIEISSFVSRVEVTDAKDADTGQSRPYGMGQTGAKGTPTALVGTTGGIIDQLQRQRETLDISYIAVFGPALEMMAPIVAKLAGT